MVSERKTLFMLEDILDRESYILSDTMPLKINNGSWYGLGVSRRDSFLDIDSDMLRRGLHEIGCMYDLFLKPSIHTTKNVLKEMMFFSDMMITKFDWLLGCDGLDSSSGGSKVGGGSPCGFYGRIWDRNISLMESVCLKYLSVIELAEAKRFTPDDFQAFDALESVALKVGKMPGVKVDLSSKFCRRKKPKKDLHADEDLIASAVYRSIFQQKSSAIITCDSDLARILRGVYVYLQDFDRKDVLNSSMRMFPVRVYLAMYYKRAKPGLFYVNADTSVWDPLS